MSEFESREVQLGRVFVRLADTLVHEFDVVDVLQELTTTCVSLLNAAAAGLMLADELGELHIAAASSEEAKLLEVFELQTEQGPCLDCYRTGHRVTVVSAEEQTARWPAFVPSLRERGFGPVHALPLRLREQTIGALNLFSLPDNPLSEAALQIGQALADVATIAVLEHRRMEASTRLASQLQIALNSRIAVEQAKGVVAAHAEVNMDRAFHLIRSHARSKRRQLSDVAADIASGRLSPANVITGDRRP
jgi:transcriptional regulator with GAF, ATPase, and Fis domain